MRLSDRVNGLFLMGLGAAAAYGGSRLPPVPGQNVGPNVFPMVIGFGLVFCGALIALHVGHKFEEEAEAETGLPVATGPTPSLWWAVLPPLLLLFYLFAVERLGFTPTAAIVAFVTARALRGSLKLAIGVAVLGPVLVHLVFAKLLRVPLPAGLLPMPW